MFSPELMEKISTDLNCLNKQILLTRTFEFLYDRSLSFHTFQSYVQHNNLIQYVCEFKQNERLNPDLNKFVDEFNSYHDLRICECADYVMTIYIKLVEYHTNLYDMYEKLVDSKRDCVRLKQFDRIMYYRIEICKLLLRCNCLQRLLVEIENGRKFLEKFYEDTINQEDFIYRYQYLIVKYTYDLFQAILLQHSRGIRDSKKISEQCLKELNQAYQEKIWEKLISDTDLYKLTSANEKRQQYVCSKNSQSKDSSTDYIYESQSSTSSVSYNLIHYFLY
jgi:hypothetical protein